MALTIGPCIPFIRPRLPIGKSRRGADRSKKPKNSIFGDKRALKDRRFWVFLVANTLQGLSFFLPSLYLPSPSRPYIEQEGVC